MILDLRNHDDVEIFVIGLDRRDGEVTGITSGCYDLLHHYHLLYFQRCRRLCDTLIVGVDCDDLVRQVKGKNRPIVPEHSRLAMVDALKPIQATFLMGSVDDFARAVQNFSADIIFRNQEWMGREKEVAGANLAKVVIIPDIPQVDSTSKIIEEIHKR